MPQLRYLSAEDIRKAVNMRDVVDAMRPAFIELSEGRAIMPLRSHIDIEAHAGTALFMPSYLKVNDMIGIKTVTLFENNPEDGHPYIQGLVSLMDGENGVPLAVMNGSTLTSLRTGAASGLATELLARKDASVVAIFGAGIQGRTQLEAVCAVRDIKKAKLYDPYPKGTKRFVEEMSEFLGIEIEVAATPKEALEGVDIICAATVSETPIFDDADLPEGVHLNAVGSYKPHVQEIPEETVVRAKLVVDHCEDALVETGDLIIPIKKGLMSAAHIYAELGEIADGRMPGRTSDTELTFFKSVGVAVQDLTAGEVVLRRAEEMGIGTMLEL